METEKQKPVTPEKSSPPTISLLLGKSAGFLGGKSSATPRLDAELLLAEVLGMERVDLYIHYDQPLNPDEVDRYRELVRRRSQGEPVAYILGRSHFRDLTLKVDPAVLVPRPETEHVVEAALVILEADDWDAAPPEVLDIGTGSGAIALAVAAAFPDAAVTATDDSGAALELAAENAGAAGLASRVTLVHSDLFTDLDPLHTFDIIISNPPYIAADEWESLPVDVRDYEPQEALFGGADGLDFYRRIIVEAHQFLKPDGSLIFEIGYRQADDVLRLLEESGAYRQASVGQDYAGNDRVVIARRA